MSRLPLILLQELMQELRKEELSRAQRLHRNFGSGGEAICSYGESTLFSWNIVA
jgi:hypothetical protein